MFVAVMAFFAKVKFHCLYLLTEFIHIIFILTGFRSGRWWNLHDIIEYW